MARFKARRHAIELLTVLLAVIVIPLEVNAAPAQAAASPKAVTADKLKAPKLDGADADKASKDRADKEAKEKPQVPSGDFTNPPAREALADQGVKTEKRDHFDAKSSKIVDHKSNADIYQNADGTQSADIFGSAVNFKDSKGDWQKIDNRLMSDDGKLKNTAGPVDFELDDATSTTDSLGAMTINGNKLDFKLSGVKGGKKGAVKDNAITYGDALDNTDIRYSVLGGNKLKEEIVVKSRPATAPTYSFSTSTKGLAGSTSPDGTIVFKDKAGKVAVTIPQGTMYDSSEHPDLTAAPVKVTLNADGKGFTVAPDATWFNDPARVFPVTIDPTYDGSGYNDVNYYDSFVYQNNPNTNYDAWPESGGYIDKAGYAPYAPGEHYTYMFQDLSFLNGRQILNGTMQANFIDASTTADLKMYPVAYSWGPSTITWNNKPSHMATSISTRPANNAWSNIDMTTWVQNWTSGGWGNNGISFDTAGANVYYRWWSDEVANNNPRIHVTYNTLPPASNPTTPVNGATVMTQTPTLNSPAVTDPDGDQVQYWYRLSNTDNPENGQTTNSGWLTSPNWNVPTGSLIDGVTYSWYVFTKDPNSLGGAYTVSATSKFKVNLRLGAQPTSTIDTYGPISTNLVNGNVMTSTSSPSFKTVGGDVGLSYSYNSQAPSTYGLQAKYYDGCGPSGSFPGEPRIVRNEPVPDFNWPYSPGPGVSADNWCANFSGYISIPRAGNWCFDAASDDGVVLTIDNKVLRNRWSSGSSPYPDFTYPDHCISVAQASSLKINMDYFDNTGGAYLVLWAHENGSSVAQFVPQANWFSTTASTLPQGWEMSAAATASAAYNEAILTTNSVVL